jgi:glycyl-tRNA synthetase (class II)
MSENTTTPKTPKRVKSKRKKNAGSQKRFVVPMKFFVSPEEKEKVLSEAIKFGSISNYVRHHLGFVAQSVGRKKKNITPAFEIIETDETEILELINLIEETENFENKASTISTATVNIQTIEPNITPRQNEFKSAESNNLSRNSKQHLPINSLQGSLFDL